MAREPADPPSLTQTEQQQLQKDKVLVSRQEVKQCFTAYMDDRYPRFVTSDAVLNAYHVLFEETLRQLEEVQARHARVSCTGLWRALATVEKVYEGDAAQVAAAKRRAQFVTGVAVRLLGEKLGECEAALKQEIDTAVAAIEKGEGMHKPAMLGSPEPDFVALDHSLFRPTGFYAGRPRLQQYFRASRWLQVVPFRAARDEELLAFHMLEMAIGQSEPKAQAKLEHALRQRWQLKAFSGDDEAEFDLLNASISRTDQRPVQLDRAFFNEHRDSIRRRTFCGRIRGNDRVRETAPDVEAREFRVFASLRLPEDEALATLGRQSAMAERSPGLEFAAWLGLPPAEGLLKARLNQEALDGLPALRPHLQTYGDPKTEAIPWWKRVRGGHSLGYRAALRQLAEVDARAPAFMKGDVWKTKTLQAVTSSWAQERHAWSLQAMPVVHLQSAAPSDKGFVEPVPEFFLQLAAVANGMVGLASLVEANTDPVAPICEKLQAQSALLRQMAADNAAEDDAGYSRMMAAELLIPFRGLPPIALNSDDVKPPSFGEVAQELDKLRAELEHEARPGSDLWEKVMLSREYLTPHWHELHVMCLRLAMMAEKQLQQAPLSERDQSYIENIGETLSAIMLYRGQAMIFPQDDAPRIALIASDPTTGQVLHAGIGRPRLLFVLYPWEGRELLCRGVVMPYHEVTDPKSLTDAEWRARQNDETRPPVPAWLQSLVPVDKVTLQLGR